MDEAHDMMDGKQSEAGSLPVDSNIGNEAIVGDMYWLWESGLQSVSAIDLPSPASGR